MYLMEDALAHSYADVYGEYIMIWAAIMMLTASRPIIDCQPVDLTRLNRARGKRGEPPRLDHTRVTLHLQRRAGSPQRPRLYSQEPARASGVELLGAARRAALDRSALLARPGRDDLAARPGQRLMPISPA